MMDVVVFKDLIRMKCEASCLIGNDLFRTFAQLSCFFFFLRSRIKILVSIQVENHSADKFHRLFLFSLLFTIRMLLRCSKNILQRVTTGITFRDLCYKMFSFDLIACRAEIIAADFICNHLKSEK